MTARFLLLPLSLPRSLSLFLSLSPLVSLSLSLLNSLLLDRSHSLVTLAGLWRWYHKHPLKRKKETRSKNGRREKIIRIKLAARLIVGNPLFHRVIPMG